MAKFQTPPIQGQQFLDGQEPTYPWKRWFELVQAALSSATTVVTVPATANSPGTPNQVATDGNFLYVCVGVNQWKRAALAAF